MIKTIQLFMVGIIFVFSFSGCEVNLTTAHITDVQMCSRIYNNQCPSDNPFFSANTPEIFVSCLLKNAPDNTDVEFHWFYMADKAHSIDKVVLSSGDQMGVLQLQSSLNRPNNNWPSGEYEVRLKILGTEKEPIVKKFRVE